MTQENSLDIREQISALVDGQADAMRLQETLQWLAADAEARAEWNAYHVVGEVLRGGERAASLGASAAFAGGVMARLAAEPAPRPVLVPAPAGVVHAEAANQPVFRWKIAAGLASLAAVAAIGWNLAGSVAGLTGTAGVQLAASPVPGSQETQVMIRDPRLDELMAAHKQAGGVSALQMPAGFLRNATFEGNER